MMPRSPMSRERFLLDRPLDQVWIYRCPRCNFESLNHDDGYRHWFHTHGKYEDTYVSREPDSYGVQATIDQGDLDADLGLKL